MIERATGSADELRDLISHAEEVIRTITGQGDEAVTRLRERVEATVRNARAKLETLETDARTLTSEAATSADEYVRENPWGAVAVAAAAGVIIGALLGRRV